MATNTIQGAASKHCGIHASSILSVQDSGFVPNVPCAKVQHKKTAINLLVTRVNPLPSGSVRDNKTITGSSWTKMDKNHRPGLIIVSLRQCKKKHRPEKDRLALSPLRFEATDRQADREGSRHTDQTDR